jgi:hypothetical protein
VRRKLLKILLLIPLIFVIFVASVIIYFIVKPIPIDFSKVSKVEFYECGDISEKFRLLSLENNEDIALINGIFKNAKGDWYGKYNTPGCSFGLQVVFYEGNKKKIVELGTDDCGLIICNEAYYQIPEDDFKILEEFLERRGINIHEYI